MSNKSKWQPISELPDASYLGDATLSSDFQWSEHPNFDPERVVISLPRLELMQKIGGLAASHLASFAGKGAEYQTEIKGLSSLGEAIGGKTKLSRPADPHDTSLYFPEALYESSIPGFGRPVAIHRLNRTAITDQVDQLKAKYPSESDAETKAWAIAVDEGLRQSIRAAGKANLCQVAENSKIDQFVGAIWPTMVAVNVFEANVVSVPFIVLPWVAINLVDIYRAAILEDTSWAQMLEDAKFSISPLPFPKYDRYIALNGISRTLDLIRYRK